MESAETQNEKPQRKLTMLDRWRILMMRLFLDPLSIVAPLLMTLSGVVIAIMTLSSITNRRPDISRASAELERAFNENTAAQIRFKEQLDKLRSALEAIPPGDTRASLIALKAQNDDLSQRLSDLEKAINSSPEKALALPLLQQDVNHLKDTMNHYTNTTVTYVTSAMEQMKWLIGLIGVFLTSLLVLVLRQPKQSA